MPRAPSFSKLQLNGITIATFLLLLVALLFGGASRLHELRLAAVELAALPLLVLAVLAIVHKKLFNEHRLALLVLLGVAAIPLVQLIPLPPQIWTGLPGRSELSLGLEVVGLSPQWAPATLTPDKTWRSFMALLPPAAMFLGVLCSTSVARSQLSRFLLIFALVGMALGTVQIASGGDRFYPWPTTDAGNFTGFFANRNHMATLCLIGMPFATTVAVSAIRRGDRHAQLSIWFALLYLAATTVAVGLIQSRIGIALYGPTLAASLLAAWIASGRGRPRVLLLALVGGSGLIVAALGAFAIGPLLARFQSGPASEGRFENWPTVAEAATTYLPAGSGIGSFDAVYRSVEPLTRLDPTYFNQAHNDYLESWLETGWLGAAVLIAFLYWFGKRVWTAWSARAGEQRDLQRAASIAIGVVLLHSAGDYPIRTVAVATLFALCCGLLELSTRTDADLSPTNPSRKRRSVG